MKVCRTKNARCWLAYLSMTHTATWIGCWLCHCCWSKLFWSYSLMAITLTRKHGAWSWLRTSDCGWLLRWACGHWWCHSPLGVMVHLYGSFLYIVYERLVGLAAVNAIETDAQIARKSTRRKWWLWWKQWKQWRPWRQPRRPWRPRSESNDGDLIVIRHGMQPEFRRVCAHERWKRSDLIDLTDSFSFSGCESLA